MGTGEADCHTSDIGHWFAMTDNKKYGAKSAGGVEPRPYGLYSSAWERAVGDAGPYGWVARSAMGGTMWASSPTDVLQVVRWADGGGVRAPRPTQGMGLAKTGR